MEQKRAYIYAAFAVLAWSTVASAFKISLNYSDPLRLLFYACTTSLAIFFVLLLFQDKIELLRCSLAELLRSAVLGFLNPFLYYIVLFKAYSLLPAQEAQPLNYTWPIVLSILSVPLLKQKIGAKSFIAIFICFAGVLVISTRGDVFSFKIANPSGAILALCSALIWAIFWIYNTKDERDELVKLFLNFSFGFVYILTFVILFSKLTLPVAVGFLGAVYVGLFEMGLTFFVWSKALKLSENTAKISKFIYLVPFLSLIFIHQIVGEIILPSTIIGLSLIVVGIVLEEI
mgnify:CR=1 FL=1